MCGIAGHVDFDGARPAEANERLAQTMGDAIRHRGPDSGGVLQPAAGAWLSFRRLAIQDVSEAGNQPMSTPDGQAHIVFNGEAYNAGDLRPELEMAGFRFRGHSDTEVILYGCRHWGVEQAVRRLTGMFAFAYFDAQRNSISLVVDRLGKKPIYWFQTDRAFGFASELKALTRHPDCPREIDRASVADYLRLLYVPAPHSIYAGVRKLRPGHVLTLDLNSRQTAVEPFWSLRNAVATAKGDPFRGSAGEAVNETERLLLDATRIRLISDVPLGAFLSGGIDSSTVLALMQEIGSKPVRTFSIGYAHRECDESADAERIAAHLGTDHTTFRVEAEDALAVIPSLPAMFDEPFADTSQIPTHLVAKLAREHVTVALTGDGGDEVFAGYNRHVAANGLLKRLSGLPAPLKSAMAAAMTSVSPDRWQALLRSVPDQARPRAVGEKLHKLAPLLKLSEQDQYRRIVSHWDHPEDIVLGGPSRSSAISEADPSGFLDDPVERMRYLDLATYLPGDILTKVDRATMAASLEARAPLLDHRLVEWSFRVPTSVHIQNGQGKWLLRRVLEKRVPRELFERPKAGFGIPLGEWLRGPLRDWAEDLLSEPRINATGILRPDPVRKLWQDHLSGTTNGQYLLWPVLMLMAWLEEWGGQPNDNRQKPALLSA
jgi:asparagine synthase (glutamine-hydrolysing)